MYCFFRQGYSIMKTPVVIVEIWIHMPDFKTELLKKISSELSPEAVRIWFDDCGFAGLRNNRIELEIPSAFKRKMLELRLSGIVSKAASELAGTDYPVCFVPAADSNKKSSEREHQPGFEDFIRGKSNEYALASVLSAADRPAEKLPHPIYIYGEAELGKTHLLLAAKKKIEELLPETRIAYFPAADFIELFGAPAKDFLLIDDFFADGTGKLESCVNASLNSGANIIAAGRIPPDENGGAFMLPGTGIICTPADIQPPDEETLQAINMMTELRNGRVPVPV